MVKKKGEKKAEKKARKAVKKEAKEEEEGGVTLDDAFADDEDVEYGESKPRKQKKKKGDEGEDEAELEADLDEAEKEMGEIIKIENGGQDLEAKNVSIKASKPITSLKKGDKIKIDGKDYEVDAHYVMIDHGKTKEMALEIFDSKDEDYQLRYFLDQVETSLELYELQEILYVKKQINNVEW